MKKRSNDAIWCDHVLEYVCQKCGKDYKHIYRKPTNEHSIKAKQQQLCFSCAYWADLLASEIPNRVIINGYHYIVEEWTRYLLLVKTNKPFKFIRMEDGRVIKVGVVTCQGKIPEVWLDKFPNNATDITRQEFSRLKYHPRPNCKAIGCWDRYHCFWYDIKQEEEKGAWNIVPENHTVGGEECPNFVNKKNVEI